MTPKAYRLLAFDPGERTGFVLVKVTDAFDPRKGTKSTFKIMDQGVIDVNQVMRRLADLIDRCDVVEYEVWRLYQDYAQAMVGNDMQPSQVIGMIRYEAWRSNKKIISNGANIKRVALATMPKWLKDHMDLSSEQHDKDAIMHAWYAAWRYANASK